MTDPTLADDLAVALTLAHEADLIAIDRYRAQDLSVQLKPDRSQVTDLWKFVFDGLLRVQNLQLDEGNPLQAELASFLACVRDRSAPRVSGADGVAAVAAAEMVLAAIARNRW